MNHDLRHRARVFRRARIAVLAFVVGYFFLPYGVRAWIPVWLPFLAALGLELNFFLGAYLQRRSGVEPEKPDRGPQPRDLADLGAAREFEAPPLFPPEWYSVPPAPIVEEPPRYWRYVAEAIVAVALVAGILFFAARPKGWDAVPSAERTRAQAIFSREASLIAGHPARVGCDTSGKYVGFVHDADGLAFVGGTRAYLTPSICDTLYQLSFKHRVQSFPRTARALAVLGHESWHLHGVSNEALANCYGFQSGVQIAVHLGLAEKTARQMMREQLATNPSDAAGNPQYLVPQGCRDGGSNDLNPAVPGFP